MYVRKVKRKCGVRGCRNTESYAISLTREMGNSVIICKSCLGKALGAIDNPLPEPEMRAAYSEAPPLFFNHLIGREADEPEQEAAETPAEPEQEEQATEEAETPAEPEQEEQATEEAPAGPSAGTAELVCPHCGTSCKTEQGLQRHIDAKHKDVDA